MRIAVLALQGAFIEHELILHKLGVSTVQIRQLSDLSVEFDGLIIPGGESTVIGKLLKELNLMEPIQTLIANGLPVFGTCAGLILLANELENDETKHIATMDICAFRNAYGRQLGSFVTYGTFGEMENVCMPFIRAPYIKKVGPNVKVLSMIDGKIVAAQQNNQLVTAFHPELKNDTRVHEYFINMIESVHF